jgi:hypothetical protein
MVSCTWTQHYCLSNCVRYNNDNNKDVLWRGIKLHEIKKVNFARALVLTNAERVKWAAMSRSASCN